MPRVTVDWDDHGKSTSQSSQTVDVETLTPADGGAAPGMEDGSTTGGATGLAGEDAGGPPSWLVEEIARAGAGESARASGQDAGPAPA